jgi:hydroxymethylpyrimidine pyrophosphatase-like HAD family hydrolase
MGHLETFSKGMLVAHSDKRGSTGLPAWPDFAERRYLRIVDNVVSGDKTAWLMFDVDGVLIRAGLETLGVSGTIENYAAEKEVVVAQFKRRITNLKKQGFSVALNTGRGAAFARRVVELMFPAGSVSKMVCESGALIVTIPDGLSEETHSPQNVRKEGLTILSRHRDEIVAFAHTLGAEKERGEKEIILSLNPQSPMGIESFFDEIVRWIERSVGVGKLEVNHSKTAVDISPFGVDKRAALKEAVGNSVVAYFGDAPGDEQAMLGCEINITPGNALPSTKEIAKKATFGLVVREKDEGLDEISGVVEALRVIELYARFGQRYGQRL